MSGWELTVEERRQATWEHRGLVEVGGALLTACRVCGARDEVYSLDVEVVVGVLLELGWGFEERGLRPWLWSSPDH